MQSFLPARKMCRLFYLTFCTVLAVNAHQSFRIAAMTRGLHIGNATSEIIGGASHDCYRTCLVGDVRTCVYSFTVMEYTTMSSLCDDCPFTNKDCYNNGCITTGGEVRPVIVVNHMLPGPSIQVCEGDTVQVNVINALLSDSVSIHWHGLHQIGTPYMDGVAHLTQCPIHPHSKFKYNFTADPAGTHMWHAHSGFHEADGLYGSFVVRVPDDPLSKYYDYDLSEHLMIVWHWFSQTSVSIFTVMPSRNKRIRGHSLTINGLAATVKYERDGVIHMTPRAEFTITQGYRYRFRLVVNTAIYCPIQVSVDNHTMLLIASDGAPFEPVEVDTLIINAGERYDFVLTADQEIGNYWIRYRAHGGICSPSHATVSEEAILRYVGADNTDPPGTTGYDNAGRSGVLLNPVAELVTDYSNNTLVHIRDLNSTVPRQTNVSGTPDHIIYLQYTFNKYYEFHPRRAYAQFNNVTFEFPRIPVLTQYDEITDDMFCTEDDDSAKDCFGTYCTCPSIYAVDVGSLVEMVLVDTTPTSVAYDDHPFHLHGQYFHVVAMENGNGTLTMDDMKSRNEAGLIDKKFDRSPLKDTIAVPAQGFAVLRFVAKNPGYWFFHCHVADHLELGMAIVIKIGKHEEMDQPPPGFPKCGNYDVTQASDHKL